MQSGANWQAGLGKVLVPSLQPPSTNGNTLEDSQCWSSDRILTNAEACSSGSEETAQRAQRFMQAGKHAEALRYGSLSAFPACRCHHMHSQVKPLHVKVEHGLKAWTWQSFKSLIETSACASHGQNTRSAKSMMPAFTQKLL